jgi:hypothetical protein
MKYHYEVHDDCIDPKLQTKVWDYIQRQKFYATRKNKSYPDPGTIVEYYPFENKKEYMEELSGSVNNQFMHRCIFGDNEKELMMNHPPILELWLAINNFLGNKFKIDGDPEGIAIKSPTGKGIVKRVYVNAQPNEMIKRSHAVHRDTVDLSEETHYTLLYIANPEWYSTWFGENVFYESDEDSLDKQQFQKGFGQSRGFGIGDPYAIIPPKPGRIILYDGRTLHTTKPTSIWSNEMRKAVVFRIRKVRK